MIYDNHESEGGRTWSVDRASKEASAQHDTHESLFETTLASNAALRPIIETRVQRQR